MPNRNITDSPTMADLQAAERQQLEDENGHVTRKEFRLLRNDVHEMKEAMLGTLERPGFLEKFRTMQQKIGLASKLAWIALIGAGGLAGKAAWDKLTGLH